MSTLTIADRTYNSRLFLGTGKFSSNQLMADAIEASHSELVTVALKRVNPNDTNDEMIDSIQSDRVHLLPNTSGVRTAKEAIFAAELAREAMETNWLKLEIHPDPNTFFQIPLRHSRQQKNWRRKVLLSCRTSTQTQLYVNFWKTREQVLLCLLELQLEPTKGCAQWISLKSLLSKVTFRLL